MQLNTLHDLLIEELHDLYSAETQIIEALPKMVEAATSPELKEAFSTHLEETKSQSKRLEVLFEQLQEEPKGKTCNGMKGVLEEASELLKLSGTPSVIDEALIGAAQRVEHYEIAGYGTAVSHAEKLGEDDIAAVLKEILLEERKTDEALTSIAQNAIVEQAINEDLDDEEDAESTV